MNAFEIGTGVPKETGTGGEGGRKRFRERIQRFFRENRVRVDTFKRKLALARFAARERRARFFERRKARLKTIVERVRNMFSKKKIEDNVQGENLGLGARNTAGRNEFLALASSEAHPQTAQPVETERLMRIKWYALLLMEKADELMNWLAPHLTDYRAPEPERKLPWWWTAVRQPIGKMFEVAADTGYGVLGWKKFAIAAAITTALNALPGFAVYTMPFVYPIVLAMIMFKLRVLDLDFLVQRVNNPAVSAVTWTLKGIGYAINLLADGTIGDANVKRNATSAPDTRA